MIKGLVSIIIRTKNEERWINSCIKSILNQSYKSFEIIIVDNNSSDQTLNIVSNHSDIKTVSIEKYLPGDSLNKGIEASKGEFIVCISAHCIPVNSEWLKYLVETISSDDKCAGCYGRQIPVSFTPNIDKRDLFTVFGIEKRIQHKDYFFHNANSIIKRKVWNKIPFDKDLTNIEDRVWGKSVINKGYNLIYQPLANVYHYHGLNQSNANTNRLNGIVNILENNSELIPESPEKKLPKEISPGEAEVFVVIPVLKKDLLNKKLIKKQIQSRVDNIVSSSFVSEIYVVSHVDLNINNSKWINKNLFRNADNIEVSDLLLLLKKYFNKSKIFPYALCFLNWSYKLFDIKNLEEIIYVGLSKGSNTSFISVKDYSHFWKKKKKIQDYERVDSQLIERNQRQPFLKALYGQGLFVLTSILCVSNHDIFEKNVSIVLKNDKKLIERISNENN